MFVEKWFSELEINKRLYIVLSDEKQQEQEASVTASPQNGTPLFRKWYFAFLNGTEEINHQNARTVEDEVEPYVVDSDSAAVEDFRSITDSRRAIGRTKKNPSKANKIERANHLH